MLIYLVLYWWVAVIIDVLSTIIYYEWYEETNPFGMTVWRDYGDIGFIILALLIGLIGMGVILLVNKYVRIKYPIWITMILLTTFKVMVAMTNLEILPYWTTDWLFI